MKRRVLSFNYTLKDNQGQVLDQSTDGPLSFLEGASQIIPALEASIVHMMIGQKKIVKLKAEEAYGVSQANMIMDVPRADLAHLQIQVGGFLQLELGEQLKVVRITAITDEKVTLDGNHPLAGQDLEFDIEMMDSRDATSEEMAHGHAHGPGGHHH